MDKLLEQMTASEVFSNLTESELRALTFCFKTFVLNVKKGEYIVQEGQSLENVVLILSGSARTQTEDYFGNETIIQNYSAGNLYGLEEAFLGKPNFRFALMAISDCTLLMLNRHRLVKCCENNCPRHQKVINNCIFAIARNATELEEKLTQISKRSTTEKVLAYLQNESKKNGSAYFDIPYNRQELADYLSVDRSALSSTLAKMKTDGIIDFNKNHFRLNPRPSEQKTDKK